jgi:glycosyltransferase involved in cell wall biosynthesis
MRRDVTLVLGTAAGGTAAHVGMLAAGLAGRGISVQVAGPAPARPRFAAGDVRFVPVEIGGRPRPGDLVVMMRLRRLLRCPAQCAPGDGARGGAGGGRAGDSGALGSIGGSDSTAHAHGMRAGALTVLALTLLPGERRPSVVVTVHNGPPATGGPARLIFHLLELVVARGADLVLCVSPDLERRMHRAGARRVRRAVIAAADPPPGDPEAPGSAATGPVGAGPAGRPASGRPVVLAAGRLAAQKGLGTLLDAAASWRDLDPEPLVVIAGDGPLAGELRARADTLGVAAVFLGQVTDVPARLAAAAVFVLPSRWEGQPLVLQEALRAGVPVVAARVGGVATLTGEDAALLVPPGDAPALAAAVRAVLTDAALAARLRRAAAGRAAVLPSEDDAVTAALAAYADAAAPRPGPGLR